MSYPTDLYLLTTRTNLHVGSGDSHFGVIDNLVQRDPLTKLPAIYASSLKGALKEHSTGILGQKKSYATTKELHKKEPFIQYIFGNDDDSGHRRFLGGNLLTFPVRTSGPAFLPGTTPQLIRDFIELADALGVTLSEVEALKKLSELEPSKGKPFFIGSHTSVDCIEYRDIKPVPETTGATIPAFLKTDSLVILSHEDMLRIAGPNKLPVQARNSLVDRESKNLWYEEYVPRQAVFYSFVINTQGHETHDPVFDKQLAQPVQMGANASVGFGVVTFKKIETPKTDALQ